MRSSVQLAFVSTLSVVLLPSALFAKDKKQEEAEALLARARDATDVRADRAPFRLRAQVRLLNLPGGVVEGAYEEVRRADGHWRKVFHFPEHKFALVEVGDGQRFWRWGHTKYEPYALFRLRRLLDFPGRLRVQRGEQIREVETRQLGRLAATCIELRGARDTHRTLWLAGDSGRPVREQERRGPLKVTYEYSDYLPWSERAFPRLLREVEQGKVFVEVTVKELAREGTPPPSLFTPPSGAHEWAACDDPEPPQAVERPQPRIPPRVRFSRPVGNVLIYAVVGEDGKAYSVAPLESRSRRLATTALDTIARKWRFRPATCNGEAVPTAVLIEAVTSTVY